MEVRISGFFVICHILCNDGRSRGQQMFHLSVYFRYSQVSRPYRNSPGCVVLSDDPAPLIAAGDAFTHSNFDGCVASAKAVIDQLVKL